MSNFSIHPNSVDVDKQKLMEISKRLRTIQRNVDQSRSAIRKNQGLMNDDLLSIISKNVLDEALMADSLYEALDKILSSYINTDQALAAKGHEKKSGNSSGGQGAGAMIGPWVTGPVVNLIILRMFWNWLKKHFGFDGEENAAPPEVTREEEKKNDKYLQSEVFKILKEDEFSKKAWKKADVEGRKDILRKFIKRLENTMGINVDDNIIFDSLGETTRGYFSYKPHDGAIGNIAINQDYLSRKDSYGIMQTLIHEMRHAYQYSAVDHPESFKVSKETLTQWKNNFNNYRDADTYGYKSYVTQPIEYDAKNFARQYSDVDGYKADYGGSWG